MNQVKLEYLKGKLVIHTGDGRTQQLPQNELHTLTNEQFKLVNVALAKAFTAGKAVQAQAIRNALLIKE